MVGPSVKDRKLAHGIFVVTVPDAGGNTRTMIGGLRFYDNFLVFHFFNTFLVTVLFYYYFWKL